MFYTQLAQVDRLGALEGLGLTRSTLFLRRRLVCVGTRAVQGDCKVKKTLEV